MKRLIVGLDPGASVGVAILDFKGNLISTYTERNANKNEIVKHISEFGKPVIVATDVNPIPHFVKRIASMTSSRTFFPQKSLTIKEKVKLVRKHRDELKDAHAKDAFAASYKAFKTYRSLLQKVETDLAGEDVLYDAVVESLIRKRTFNIKEAIQVAKLS